MKMAKQSGIAMKAIADFRGRPGEGSGDKNRIVEAGDVFTVADQGRADYLQKRELAVVEGGKVAKKVQNKAVDGAPVNQAEAGSDDNKEAGAGDAGGNPSGGPVTGDNFASLSRPDRQPAKATGKKPSANRKRK